VLAIAYLAIQPLRDPTASEPWIPPLLAALLFHLLTAASIVAGRLSPQLISNLTANVSVPGRYFTPIYAFWTCAALLVIHTCWLSRRQPVFLAFFGLLFATFMFARIKPELVQAEDWSDFFRGTDALGSAMILNIPDDQQLNLLWRNPAERNDRVAFLRQENLSFFAEPRATWPGQQLTGLFQLAAPNACEGGVESVTAVPSQGFRSWRLEGWAWDDRDSRVPSDILLTDESGRIVGLGRSGLRHGYHPGLMLNTALQPPSAIHAAHRRSEWIAYARIADPNAGAKLQVYSLLPANREVCAIGATP